MKRGFVILFSLSLILILSLSIVSAGFFSDLWNKITGKASQTENNKVVSNKNIESPSVPVADEEQEADDTEEEFSINKTICGEAGGSCLSVCPQGYIENQDLSSYCNSEDKPSNTGVEITGQITKVPLKKCCIPILDGYLDVATLKDNYRVGERVNLTDPPTNEGGVGEIKKENKKSFIEKVRDFFKGVFGGGESESKTDFVSWPKEKPFQYQYPASENSIYPEMKISSGRDLPEEYNFDQQIYTSRESFIENQKQEFKEGEILIKFKENEINTEERALNFLNSVSNYKIKTAKKLFSNKEELGLNRIYAITFDKETSPYVLIDEYKKSNKIEYAEPNYIYHTFNTPNDPFFNEQWGHQNIQSELAWDIETGDEDVVIAIVDTGIDYTHPDLIDNVWVNGDEIPNNNLDDDNNGYVDDYYGYDFFNRDGDPKDDFGHGTHVAGIAAAVTNNNLGIAGTCWNCKIMSVKFLGDQGGGYTEGGALSIIYAADNGADIISNSWGGGDYSQTLQDAINYAYNHGSFLVAAAGNSGSRFKQYPAGYENMFAVSATDEGDEKASFSNYGSWVDVGAPGRTIYSTMPTYYVTLNDYGYEMNYDYLSGTSMATPFVSGLVGLIKSKNPAFNNQEISSLLHTAVDIPNSEEYIGTGRVNAYQEMLINEIPISILDSSLDDLFINDTRTIEIIGTSIGNNFQSYKLEYGLGAYPLNWNLIEESINPVTNGILGYLDTGMINDGDYSIRLKTIGNEIINSNELSQDSVFIHINNNYLTSPLNNDVFRAGDIIEINGSVQGNGFQNYVVKYGVGENPAEWFSGGITLINNGNSQIFNNTLAIWNTDSINQANFYTIKLIVNFENRQDEENLILYLDPTLKQGWPIKLNWEAFDCDMPEFPVCYVWPGYVEPTISDINNDNVEETIFYFGGIPPKIYVYEPDGSLLSGWPVEVPSSEIIAGGNLHIPAIGDINNDGFNEIFIVGLDFDPPFEPKIFVYTHQGRIFEGYPKNLIDQSTLFEQLTRPVLLLADLNQDNELEIIIFDQAYGIIGIFDKNGNLLPGWPKDFGISYAFPFYPSTPAVGNFDSDLELEIVVIEQHDGYGQRMFNKIHVYNIDGTELQGWPIELSGWAMASPAVGDINNDGNNEIVVAVDHRYTEEGEETYPLHVFDKDGNYLEGWPIYAPYYSTFDRVWASPALADFNNDGYLEIIANFEEKTYVFDYQGNLFLNWPTYEGITYLTSTIGDVNGDNNLEITNTANDNWEIRWEKLMAWDINGFILGDFPKFVEAFAPSPVVISDIDNDGKIEILTSSSEDYFGPVNFRDCYDLLDGCSKLRSSVYAWDIEADYHNDKMPWPTFHHDNQRTGLYDSWSYTNRPKSLLNNTGALNIDGYILMKVQKQINNEWQDYQIIVNENIPRIIQPNSYLALDLIWNEIGFTPTQEGDYRVYASLRDENGNVIETYSGALENYYEFSVSGLIPNSENED